MILFNPFTVVIAEDEELISANLVQKIQNINSSFKVIGIAQTGADALTMVQELSPEVLITDIRMPVMTGLELLAHVHQQYPFIKTVIISGYSDFSYARSAIQYGLSNYLLKPIDIDELSQTLQELEVSLTAKRNAYDATLDVFNVAKTPVQLAHILYEYIVANYKEKINLTMISNKLGYNANHLTKIFHDVYHTTPNKFIISLRIQEAQQKLIHSPHLSIGQIGEGVGYPDPGYFSRIFKKQVGVSPFDYREQKKAKGNCTDCPWPFIGIIKNVCPMLLKSASHLHCVAVIRDTHWCAHRAVCDKAQRELLLHRVAPLGSRERNTARGIVVGDGELAIFACLKAITIASIVVYRETAVCPSINIDTINGTAFFTRIAEPLRSGYDATRLDK